MKSHYATTQLSKAILQLYRGVPDAEARVNKWINVLQRIDSGEVRIGSNRPTKFPKWVTLEVVTGGFATGNALAGGPLLPFEQQLADKLKLPHSRAALNHWYISEAGFDELRELLESRRYELHVPEEGALLCVAYAMQNGEEEIARYILNTISKHFAELRFYPRRTETQGVLKETVSLYSVSQIRERIRNIPKNPKVYTQREATQIWNPIYDDGISLVLETTDGDTPTIEADESGSWTGDNGRFYVVGGTPLSTTPPDWEQRATNWLRRFDNALNQSQWSNKGTHKKSSVAQLEKLIRIRVERPNALNARHVGKLRVLVARYVAKRGVPSSDQARRTRKLDDVRDQKPTHHELAPIVDIRLRDLPQQSGIEDVDPLLGPVVPGESNQNVATGHNLPKRFGQTLRLATESTVDELVSLGILKSAESLATVLPAAVANVKGTMLEDASARYLLAGVYRSFRRRRSLLLLNYQSQVKFIDLPWGVVFGIDEVTPEEQELAGSLLRQTAVLALESFPASILPNRLLTELNTLGATYLGRGEMPITKELAADIFMGGFSPVFDDAAKVAARALKATLYSRYFAIDYDKVVQMGISKYCTSIVPLKGYDVVTNGRCIERQQIVTTHNLAALVSTLDLWRPLNGSWDVMARTCFLHVLNVLQLPYERRYIELVRIKSAAYSWRQMLFYLSFADTELFRKWSKGKFDAQPKKFRSRFSSYFASLLNALDGEIVPLEQQFIAWDSNHPLVRSPDL